MKLKKFNRKEIAFLVAILGVISVQNFNFLFAQEVGSKNRLELQSSEKLLVRVNSISIDGSIEARGLISNFPHPVMAVLSVFDETGQIVTGLADTLNWLAPNDIANIGVPVNQIWNPILEYHRDNHAIPEYPDIYKSTPEPLITEIRKSTQSPTSTMLIMDFSYSNRDSLDVVKEAGVSFVNLFSELDRGGLMQVADSILNYQPLTNDKDLLIEAIQRGEVGARTNLFLPLMQAIDELKDEPGLKAIVMYCDGYWNQDDGDADDVIVKAQRYQIPIFTIVINENYDEVTGELIADFNTYERMARNTGGAFFPTATITGMEEIYGRIYRITHNYYVLAYTSPDPLKNGTWRLLDATANYDGKSGRGTGPYYVPGWWDPPGVDLGISLQSQSDSTVFRFDRDYSAVLPPDTFHYTLNVTNLSPLPVDTFRVRHVLPEDVRFMTSDVPPLVDSGHELQWHYGRLLAGESISIDVAVAMDSIATEEKVVSSTAFVSTFQDSFPDNNWDIDSLFVLVPALPDTENIDLAITQTVSRDTVFPGNTYHYLLNVENYGPGDVFDFSVSDQFPDSVIISNFDRTPAITDADSLLWEFSILPAGESVQLNFDATVVSVLPRTPFILENMGAVYSQQDTNKLNNFSYSTVWAIFDTTELPELTDAALELHSITARADTVSPGEAFTYEVVIENQGVYPAVGIDVALTLPDSVHGETPALRWYLDSLGPGVADTVQVPVLLSAETPRSIKDLVATAVMTGLNDENETNNADTDTVWVSHPYDSRTLDLAITQLVPVDTVFTGQRYPYTLRIENLGLGDAVDFDVSDVLPDSVIALNFDKMPAENSADSLVWPVEFLGAGEVLELNFEVDVASVLPKTPFELPNTARVLANRDVNTENDFSRSTVWAIFDTTELPELTDAALELHSITALADTVSPGEAFSYEVVIENQGAYPAVGIDVALTLPDSVHGDLADLRWYLDSLGPGVADTVQVPVLLSANTPRAVRQLTATAFLASKNDQNDANNSDVDILGVRHSVDNRMLDLAVRQEVVADTVITIFGQNESAVFPASSYQYAIWVKNFGPAAAEAFIVSDSLPADLAELSEFMPFEPQQSESQLLWNIDYLASGDSLLLGYSAKAPLEFTNGIELFGHTARVSASRDTFPDNDVSQIDIWGIDTNPPDTTQLTDLKITQFVKTLQFEISGEDTTFYAQAGEHYLYQLVIENLTETPAWNTTVRDMLPNFVVPTLIGENGYSPAADTVYWNLGIVPAFGRWVIPLMVKVNDEMPSGRNLLINRADVAADNEDPELLANNVCQSEAVNYGASPIDWMPEIQATPHETLVGNPIRVRVRVSIPVAEWDIHVDFADNSMSDAYWDNYITETSLPPGEWVDLDPEFMDTYFRGDKKKETITFTIFATDYNGEEKRAEDTVLIMAENELEIDRNVWNPSEDNELPINFKLDSNRYARIDLYDIAGTRITLIAEGDYLAGNNEVRWDGYTKSSQQVGSGFYLITLTAGDYYAYKKIFIVR